MRSWLLLFILFIAGCTQPTGPANDIPDATDPCSPGYYVGCDNNPDAYYMLETYGLHQFTNTSYHVNRPNIESGLVAWSQGGFGDPVSYRVLDIKDGDNYNISLPNGGVNFGPYSNEGMVMHGLIPYADMEPQYDSEKMWIWTPSEGSKEIAADFSKYSARPEGFSYPWALIRDFRPSNNFRDGYAALNVDTKEIQVLRRSLPNDNSHYGGPLVELVIGGGHAYLSMRYESPGGSVDTAIIDVNLTTGERREILNVTHTILQMDASDNYLVLNAVINGESGVWVWNRSEWLRVGSDGINPVVGGDWVVYLEQGTASNGRDALVGIHIPTLNRHVLQEEIDTGFVEWDTDGEYAIVKATANYSFQTQLQFQGTQLYWMELPGELIP